MNNMKKYELTENTTMHFGKKLFQIKALISFGEVEAGELGGWIEEEKNLDQSGNAWVSGKRMRYHSHRIQHHRKHRHSRQLIRLPHFLGN